MYDHSGPCVNIWLRAWQGRGIVKQRELYNSPASAHLHPIPAAQSPSANHPYLLRIVNLNRPPEAPSADNLQLRMMPSGGNNTHGQDLGFRDVEDDQTIKNTYIFKR
ncbi:unnamed protein product [Nezara viridula]|uniref:Uncharacterized protein n=1 Tax=Nezara viridula TaxID=85310 RepID=A0A9P0HQ01_NEZVI|nr:unnamed protein product [Nezara viridula]